MALLIPLIACSRALRSAAAAVACSMIAPLLCAQPSSASRESEIKAAALYNIIAFSEWPATAFSSPDAPLMVGVLGEGPVAALLGAFTTDEMWHGRRIVLRQCANITEANKCHVVYFARSEHGRWRRLNRQLAGLPILTVCDAENFARDGGIVQFAIDRNKLRLLVNLHAAQAASLTISSKVLRLAEIVDDRAP